MNAVKVIVFLFTVVGVNCKRFPSYIKKCHQSDPDLKTCFQNALYNLQPYLIKGIPEFHLPKMDPFILPEVSLDSGDSFKAKFKNVEIYNANKFNIRTLLMNLDKAHLYMDLVFPKLRIKSHYFIEGKLMFLHLNGNGPADGNFTNVNIQATLNGRKYIKHQKEYLEFTKLDLVENVGKPIFHFENLFRNNPELTEQTNKIVNENIDEIVKELKPVIDKAISSTVLEFIGRLFSRFSIEELFPK